jgi:hypothetical protein
MYKNHNRPCRATLYFGYFSFSSRINFRVWCGKDVVVVAPSLTERDCRTDHQLGRFTRSARSNMYQHSPAAARPASRTMNKSLYP